MISETANTGLHMDPLLPAVVGAAFGMLLVGLLLRRLKQPHVVAYLLGGVLLGSHGIDVFPDATLVARLGEFGVVLLLFFVGMEVSVPRLAEGWRVALGGTLLQIVASVGSVAALGLWLDWPMPRIVLVGFAISLSSTAVVVSTLRASNDLDSDRGRDTLGILLAQDLAVIPMLVVVGMLAGAAPASGVVARQLLGGTAIMLMVVMVTRRENFKLPFAALLRTDHELQVFAAFLLCFGFAWVTGVLGLSTALGAFVAGVVISAGKETEWVHRSLEPLRVLFVALFFVSVGMLIDLHFLAENWSLVLALVVATLVLNTAINAAVLRLLGRRLSTSLRIGAMLAQIGEFSFVLAAVGLQTGIVSEFGHQTILGVIAISLALSPAWMGVVNLALRTWLPDGD
ncbi:MAG: CPA2 family monovalent cation:H+ antiporter-2 [Pseudohongiellaceae bacterium]|jgi:CPA2 family monovalent cation:H+ antiporter-2